MKDKEIRNILIAYVKATCEEVRIYQEKSIGAAVCDVMAATNRLIGYEIKSDADNYQRLDRQITFYYTSFWRLRKDFTQNLGLTRLWKQPTGNQLKSLCQTGY